MPTPIQDLDWRDIPVFIVNRNRFWVSVRAGRLHFSVPPRGRRTVRVKRGTRRVLLRDVSGQPRRLRVPRPRSG